ncbi:homoserine kinase [Shewanella marina]|uniref:homoserine kinase n=1 Tax=Shewanella marina TaxID=487319 RepID=UPI000472F294|nr:homoserine kinase [Shewanella marina]
MKASFYAPASMGNVSVGFDMLGLALAPIDGSLLGDRVAIEPIAAGIEVITVGRFADKLPADVKLNIVYQCAQFFIAKQPSRATGLRLILEKNLPIGSGLGSSASSVVAALYALNEYFEQPYNQQQLLALMGEFEGQISGSVHYDNVAPCYLGGLQLMLSTGANICSALPSFKEWYWLVAYSGASLSTAKMRQLLPAQYDKQTTLVFGQNIASFVHACYQQDSELAMSLLQDVIAEPYRAESIPGYRQAKQQLLSLGVPACGISGSGPTMFAVSTDLALMQQAQQQLQQSYVLNDFGFSHICQIDELGTRQLNAAINY